jgi:nicotinamide mononucleotide transporter
VGVILFVIVFYQTALFAEVILQTVYIIQGFYGWYNWSKIKDKPPAPITKLTNKEKAGSTGIIVVLTAILYGGLTMFTNASIPFLDSFTSSISLVANWWLAKRKLENWHLWIFVDVFYVVMFLYKGLFIVAGLYVIFFLLAMYGLYKWKKEYYYGKYGRSYEEPREFNY